MKANEEDITHAPKGYNEKLATPPEGIGPLVKWGKEGNLETLVFLLEWWQNAKIPQPDSGKSGA